MREKKTFSIARLIVGSKLRFTLTDFALIPSRDSEEINQDGGTLNRIVEKEELENRFLSLYFEEGKTLPHPDNVYNIDKQQDERNPRQTNQIERDSQTFVLIDESEQRILISDFRKKFFLQGYFKEKTKKNVEIKNIIDKSEFLDKIKNLNTIYLSATPDFFARGVLSDELKKDVYGYGVGIKQISLRLIFDANSAPQKAKEKIRAMLEQQEDCQMKKIEVTGRTDENFERVFNAEGIVDKIEIEVNRDANGLLDKTEVFRDLANRMK